MAIQDNMTEAEFSEAVVATCSPTANEIDRLRAENQQMRRALEMLSAMFDPSCDDVLGGYGPGEIDAIEAMRACLTHNARVSG